MRGRLVPAKGQHILLAAVDRLVRKGCPISLCLVGDGPDRASLEREVECRGLRHRVTFAGSVNQDRMAGYYAEADAFVLASFAEGIPVVLMEAMAMEIPCISTMVTGIPELIRDGIDGLLVMPSDDRALAHAIEELIDNERLRRRLGEAGRQRVLDKYNLPDNIELLARLFSARLGEGMRLAAIRATTEKATDAYVGDSWPPVLLMIVTLPGSAELALLDYQWNSACRKRQSAQPQSAHRFGGWPRWSRPITRKPTSPAPSAAWPAASAPESHRVCHRGDRRQLPRRNG